MKPPNWRKGNGEFQVDPILGQVLRNAVWERLDMLSDLANRADAHSLVSVARSELPRLTEGWRAMLLAHEPDERGDCPTCSTRWHRCKAPCSVWQVAHEHLVAGGLAPQQTGLAQAGMANAGTHPDVQRQGRRKDAVPGQNRGAGIPSPAETTGRHALIATPRSAVVGA